LIIDPMWGKAFAGVGIGARGTEGAATPATALSSADAVEVVVEEEEATAGGGGGEGVFFFS
jgi:hypothetical protein